MTRKVIVFNQRSALAVHALRGSHIVISHGDRLKSGRCESCAWALFSFVTFLFGEAKRKNHFTSSHKCCINPSTNPILGTYISVAPAQRMALM